MEDIKNAFEARLTEVEAFISLTKKLASPSAFTQLGLNNHSHSLPMLKACTFLLIYNAVESCVRLTFAEIYNQIKSTNTAFTEITPALQKIWLTQQLDAKVALTSSNRDTYLSAVELIASLVANSSTIDLNARSLPISGNLNADSIRELCKKHGVELKVSTWAKGGAELDTVKEKRNALAHGHISFIECGREYALTDLERILRQTKHFMKGLLKSVEKFLLASSYKIIT